tara:strand:+ start:2855 stop:3349 length:495 start_codon:yes stop_codon:yes gene_type:complete
MKVRITETELVSLIEKVIKENNLNEGKKKKKGKKDKKWIQKAYASGDVKDDKLTDYCDGKVTCACVEKALKSKKMKKGAQMYLNMNKSKCKSLKESIILEQQTGKDRCIKLHYVLNHINHLATVLNSPEDCWSPDEVRKTVAAEIEKLLKAWADDGPSKGWTTQ